MNNPMIMLMQAVQSGRNPMQLIQQMAQSNPQMAQAAQMIRGKNPAQLQQMAHNVARERGTTVEEVARSLGIQIPSNR